MAVIDPKAVVCAILIGCQSVATTAATAGSCLSPAALSATPDGKTLFIACATADQVLQVDTATRKIIASIPMPASPSGLAVSLDGTRLFVTCAAPESKVCVVNVERQKIVGTIPAGHSATAPVLSPDGKTLYVCNRFNNDVSVIDLAAKKEVRRIAVRREPVAADITKDGQFLLVANHLPGGRADADEVAAVVSVIDLAAGKSAKELPLPTGSGILKDIKVSPDGKYAVVTHIFASFNRATTQVHTGWMNANALTLLDLASMTVRYTLLLDEPQRGAANPWGVAWSADGETLAVAHAGTHEVSLINFPALLAGLPSTAASPKRNTAVLSFVSRYEGLDEGLPFLTGARQRVGLESGDLGPRAVTIVGNKVYTANYFSDTLGVIDLSASPPQAESIALGPKQEMDAVRRGESYFHDATLCLQGWQSCSSCHPGDARVDGLNWDLLNDGVGNPKSTRSLLLAHQTPPAMFLGVRTNAETAVRAGIKFILLTQQPEAVAASMDEYLKSLKPVPSPHLVHGRLSKAARRGRELFVKTGCADCHVPGLFTDLHPYDVGTRAAYDRPRDKFYTPTLIEVWRTAPYLHDGSAATMRDVLTTRNPEGKHADLGGLSELELDDLCQYVLSL
jgi:YVTN family beta-propeller protein